MPQKKHSVEVVDHDLEMEERLGQQETGWIVQRIGWFLIVAFAVAGALGFFGNGLMSTQKATAGNVTAEFEKYYRYETEMMVLVEATDHIGSIAFPQEYLKKFRIVRFVPEPENNTTVSNHISYNFLPGENKMVTMYIVPKSYGAINGTMKVNGSNNINLQHFIYP